MVDFVFRDLETSEESDQPVREGRFIVAVIGINEYTEWPKLQNAVSDAEGTQKLFVEKLGFLAPFPPLLNEQATQDAISALVQDEMQKVLEPDDSLVLFFAGHGHTHTINMAGKKIETGYIIPVRARRDMRSDYLKMDSLLEDIGQLPARHVLVILDACHSGFALGSAMKTYRDSVNYRADLTSRVSRKVITSARREQRALDSGPIIGHSLFTGTLVQGFDTRKADLDGNGLISSYELGLYLQQQVGQSSDAKQTPDFGSFHFDDEGEMVISLRDELADVHKAQEHFKLGTVFYELGHLLDDPLRFRAAARQFRDVIALSNQSKRPMPEAEIALGKALLEAREFDQARAVFSALAKRADPNQQCEALFHLGIVEARQNNFELACGYFSDVIKTCPNDEKRRWITDYIGWLKQKAGGEKYALLIGINEYQAPGMSLRGCVNDVNLMTESLAQFCGFDKNRISVLTDEQATRQGIIQAFDQLKTHLSPQDVVVIHFSGHSVTDRKTTDFDSGKETDVYLIAHDTVVDSDKLTNGITALELHEMMKSLPVQIKTLVIDSHPFSAFNRLAEKDGNYFVLLASDKSDLAYEHHISLEGKMQPVGLFTAALTQKLAELPIPTLTYGQLTDATILKIKEFGMNQTPLLIGDREQRIFQPEEIYLGLYRFAQRRNYSSIKSETLTKRYTQTREQLKIVFPQLYYSFGRAFLEKKIYALATQALETAIEQRQGDYPEAKFALGKAQFAACLYEEAIKTFQQIADSTLEKQQATQLKKLLAQLSKLIETPKRALLVGINKYANANLPPVQGALNDIESIKGVLTRKLGFKATDITTLINESATREAILESFKKLLDASREEPALFYFCGNGSADLDEAPTIVSADGRQGDIFDIALPELAELAKGATNLVTVIDAGTFSALSSGNKTAQKRGYRSVPADDRKRPSMRVATSSAEANDGSKQKIGAVTISPYIVEPSSSEEQPKLESRLTNSEAKARPRWQGRLTQALVQSWLSFDSPIISIAQLSAAVAARLNPSPQIFLSDIAQPDYLFEGHSMRDEFARQIARIENAPLDEAIKTMWSLIRHKEKKEDYYPEGRMNVGIIHAIKGEYVNALNALERAVSLYNSQTVFKSEMKKDKAAESLRNEAHYQLGRVLFESERDFNKAVSELNEATRLDPDNVRAYYYLGQAIREMVERETLSKAEEALKTYLIRGAPLGYEDQVREFLGSRKGTGAG